jgi:hypothetical protein
MPRRNRTFSLFFGLILLAVGVTTYSFCLGLPFFSDDIPQFRWLHVRDAWQILRDFHGVGRYRPLPFLVWKALWSWQGPLSAPLLHAVNIGFHLLNTFLVWGLIKGQPWGKGTILGPAAALLFLLYPFSYQAISWIGALTHPMSAAMIMGALYLHQMSRLRSSRWLSAGSLALTFLAPFATENGFLIAPLLVLLLLTRQERPSLQGALRETRFHWLCTLVSLGLWLAVPQDTHSVPVPIWNLEARYQNGVYLLQGLSYPVAPLARHIWAAGWGLDDLQSVLLISVPVVLLWGILLWKAGDGRPLLLAVGWFVLTILPVWLMFQFEYVMARPRLMYLASFGASLLWAYPVALSWQNVSLKKGGPVVALIAVLVLAGGGYRFIQERAELYEQQRRFIDQFVRAVRAVSSSGPALGVNCPQFLVPRNPVFAVGREGVFIMAPQQLGSLFWVNTGEERTLVEAVLPDLQRDWKYYYAGTGPIHTAESLQEVLRGVTGAILTSYEREDIAVYPAGGLEASNVPPQNPFIAEFDGRVRLLSATTEREGSILWVTLRWQSLQPLPEDTTVFLHLLSPSGQLVGQRDGYPVMGLSRLTVWQPGDIWKDIRPLYLPEGLSEGEYTLTAGLYLVGDSGGGSRLRAIGPDGQSFPDNAVPIARVTPD